MTPLFDAVATLRAAGWTLTPPPDSPIPPPVVGVVWWSPLRNVEPRTVVAIGPTRGWHNVVCVSWTSPSRPALSGMPRALPLDGWEDWARVSGARP